MIKIKKTWNKNSKLTLHKKVIKTQMADVISKDSIVDMPDNSDMIAEAMK